MSKKLSVNGLKWVEVISQFNKDFLKSYNEESDEGYFLKFMFNILKIYMTSLTMIYLFYLKK